MESLKKGEKAAKAATLITFLLAAIKAVIGFTSGSNALISDALHSVADSVIMFASWLGLRIAQRKPDKRFPYGYYKAESIAMLFVSIFILYASIELMISGYTELFTKTTIRFPIIAFAAAVGSVVVSWTISSYLKVTGESINSQLLVTTSKERLMDAVSSTVVAVSVVMSFYGFLWVDGIAAMGIALFVLRIGIISVRDSILALMDVSPSKESEERIRKIISDIKGVKAFGRLRLRRSGPFIFGEVTVKIKKDVSVDRAHEIADEIERRIKKQVSGIESFVIHVEPHEKKRYKIAVPVSEKNGLTSKVVQQFGRAPCFLFATVSDKEIGEFYIKENPYKDKPIRAGLYVAHLIVKEGVDVLLVKDIGEISFHVLHDHLVDIYKVQGNTAEKAIKNFIKGRLKRIIEPTREVS